MRFMAAQAVSLHHVFRMGGMAVGAARQFAMGGMTGGAGLFGMFAWILFQLFNLIRMTGKAGFGQIVGKGDFKRCVRVRMAAQTAFKLKMLFACMAHAALRNNVGLVGRMTLMAFNTGNFCLMFAPCTFNGLWGGIMAFYTIVDGQSGPLSILRQGKGCRCAGCQEDCKSCDHRVFYQLNLFIFFAHFHLNYPPDVEIKRISNRKSECFSSFL